MGAKAKRWGMRWLAWLAVPAMVLAPAVVALAAPVPASGVPASGVLYFTTYQNQGTCTGTSGSQPCTPDVWKVSYTYSGSSAAGAFQIVGSPEVVATTQGADGLVAAGGSNLLVGGQFSGKVFQVDPNNPPSSSVTGQVYASVYAAGVCGTGSTCDQGSFHLTLGPSGHTVWTSGYNAARYNGGLGGEPGPLAAVPVNPLTQGTAHPLSGSDTTVTQLAFVPGQTGYAWYTSGNRNGTGDLGILNLTTYTTTAVCTGVPWAHGIAYDAFTGDLMVGGGTEIAQINPNLSGTCSGPSDVVLHTFPFSSGVLTPSGGGGEGHIDYLQPLGNGLLFAGANSGQLLFMDYSTTSNISTPYYYAGQYSGHAPFLNANLDDIANQLPEAPYAGALLLAMMVPMGLWMRRRRLQPGGGADRKR